MGWTLEDHTADVLLRVEARSWAELLCEAAACFGAFVSGEQTRSGARTERVELVGVDPADAWVRYWRALHRLWTVEGLLPVGARVAPGLAPPDVRAEVLCAEAGALEPGRCEDVKAVTWHGAEAGEREGAWIGRIVLDV